ncbi:hypothetical protein CYMTET_38774 [Cymbomonas tetramitiformis]|uniref:Fatty acid hydroxylase domain-containing protein n=1 Tax=Cymbomonas tetramitiformis TaxID=36881 RepID=A0AAE0CCW4_9CHLO|nr:hypothetical protein CYMTET_38774 [Cymbomonas tetramitiformis]
MWSARVSFRSYTPTDITQSSFVLTPAACIPRKRRAHHRLKHPSLLVKFLRLSSHPPPLAKRCIVPDCFSSPDSAVVDTQGGTPAKIWHQLDVPHYTPRKVPRWFLLLLTFAHNATYGAIGILLTCLSPSAPWWALVVSSNTTATIGILTHWAGHQRWSRAWFKTHVPGHHTFFRPEKRFLTDAARTDERQFPGEFDERLAYIPSAFTGPLLLAALQVPGTGILAGVGASVFLLLAAEELHNAFHTAGHQWERWEMFHYLRSLHYYHHARDMQHNFAMGDFSVDWLLFGVRRQ